MFILYFVRRINKMHDESKIVVGHACTPSSSPVDKKKKVGDKTLVENRRPSELENFRSKIYNIIS